MNALPLRLRVSGMTCGHCEQAVVRAIRMLDQQAEVRIDRAAELVEVRSSASAQSLRQAIVEEGYGVTTIET